METDKLTKSKGEMWRAERRYEAAKPICAPSKKDELCTMLGAQPRHLERESNDVVCRMAQGSAAPQSPIEVWTPREMVPSRLSRLMMCKLSDVHGPIGGMQSEE